MAALEPPKPNKNDQVNILFTADMNDISSDKKGGHAEIAYFIKQKRVKYTPFSFFGGGSIDPSLLSSFDRGSQTINLLNSIEPDVMAITKRDFSFFEDELSLRSYEAAFPFVSTKVIDKETNLTLNGLQKSIIAQQGNYKVGVLSTLSIVLSQNLGVIPIVLIKVSLQNCILN